MKYGYEYVIDFLRKEGIEFRINSEHNWIDFKFKSYDLVVFKKESTELEIALFFHTSYNSQDLLEISNQLNQWNKKYNKAISYYTKDREVGCVYYTDKCFSSDEVYPIICKLDESRQTLLRELTKQIIKQSLRELLGYVLIALIIGGIAGLLLWLSTFLA